MNVYDITHTTRPDEVPTNTEEGRKAVEILIGALQDDYVEQSTASSRRSTMASRMCRLVLALDAKVTRS